MRLRYGIPVWNPFHKGESDCIENVQKFALRMCLKSWNSDYEELLENTHIPTLSSRRTQASMCHLSKIVKKQTHFHNAPIVSQQNPYNTRASNQNTLVAPKAITMYIISILLSKNPGSVEYLKRYHKLYQSEYLTYNCLLYNNVYFNHCRHTLRTSTVC